MLRARFLAVSIKRLNRILTEPKFRKVGDYHGLRCSFGEQQQVGNLDLRQLDDLLARDRSF